ncbi:hypothetical protein DTL42_11160 [Bremerella cremea]|uniref:Uncharacterized protein n=1 Tax=Bremerella cremea TaxID=1031537 RepID=A0A368KUC3_9BACT|nr:hypothetical protein DTL42_11160 [Bremerella cremea]
MNLKTTTRQAISPPAPSQTSRFWSFEYETEKQANCEHRVLSMKPDEFEVASLSKRNVLFALLLRYSAALSRTA